MKTAITIIIWLFSLPVLAETATTKVNYHLRKMQTVMDSSASKARVDAIKVDESKIETQEVYLRNHPGFGLGDEGLSATPENLYDSDSSHSMTAEESVRRELVERRRVTNVEPQAPVSDENADFIKEFKDLNNF